MLLKILMSKRLLLLKANIKLNPKKNITGANNKQYLLDVKNDKFSFFN